MRAALYARISTHDGRQFTENQIADMRRYAAREGWTIVREYVDKISGSRGTDGRGELAQLMTDAELGRFDVVLVFSLDRFTREGVLKAFQHIERLTSSGVKFRSVTEEHFQTSGPAGELFMAVSAWMAKQERTQLRNRIMAGLERARLAGVRFGRRPLKIDLVRLAELREDGRSLREISALMKLGHATVHRHLKKLESRARVLEMPKSEAV